MNAPVATNSWNLALATKKTTSGTSWGASLNSGCGWGLFMSAFNPCDRLCEIPRGERREIVDPLANTDEMHRQFVFFGQRHQNAAARGAVELGHHQTGYPCGAMECL